MSPIPQKVNSIGVIVGRDLIGDALIKLPFVRALRNAFPQASIHWITSQGSTAYGNALRDATHSLINEVHEQPEWLKVTTREGGIAGGQTPAPHFDVLIDTRNRWREARLARQVPHNIFIAPAMRFLFSEKRPALWRKRPLHLCDRLLQMVELAAGYVPPSTGALDVPEALMQKARAMLPEGSIYVGLAPGAGNPVKIWPRYKFEKLAALQIGKGRVPVFILGPQELSAHGALSSAVPSALFPLQDYNGWGTAQLTIDHTLALARRLDVAVANDSGVGHMLAAADCPLISLFGPTSPAKLAPRVSRGFVIRAQDYGSEEMKAITWENVGAAVDRMLEGQ
ncbi:MAG: glycosyltransferase family 9 protein [Alphaproteobacteria bacterium]|nr:glycosyltransferase family 9 protein [Alphaproteobacteria bacterium]